MDQHASPADDSAQFFQRRGCGFEMQTRGASSFTQTQQRELRRLASIEDVDRILADLQRL
jgi:hypothetical protein